MTAPTAAARPPFTIKGWHVAAGVVGFFALIIAVDMAFLVLAYRTHPGQVAAKPYEAGLVFNAELDRQRAQAALGWRAGVKAEPAGLEVVLQDAAGDPLTGLQVAVLLQRPATEQGRAELTLTERSPGRYAAPLTLSGTWDARIDAKDTAGRRIVAERRLTWP